MSLYYYWHENNWNGLSSICVLLSLLHLLLFIYNCIYGLLDFWELSLIELKFEPKIAIPTWTRVHRSNNNLYSKQYLATPLHNHSKKLRDWLYCNRKPMPGKTWHSVEEKFVVHVCHFSLLTIGITEDFMEMYLCPLLRNPNVKVSVHKLWLQLSVLIPRHMEVLPWWV